MKRIIFISSIFSVLILLIVVVISPTFTSKSVKSIKLRNGSDSIAYSKNNLLEIDINDINDLDASKYDYVLIKDNYLNDDNVRNKMVDIMENGNQVLILGDNLIPKELLDKLELDSSTTYESYEGRFIPNTGVDRSNRASKFITPQEKNKETFSLIGVGLYDINKKIPYLTLIPADQTKEQIDNLIKDILNTPIC